MEQCPMIKTWLLEEIRWFGSWLDVELSQILFDWIHLIKCIVNVELYLGKWIL